jgi:DNA-binding response OmpR family regulator
MKKIVIIEDEPVLQKALSIQLLSDGVSVHAASDGVSGLDLVREKHPNLVLLDLVLPKMRGFEVLKEIKKDSKTKNIPVIVLSNLSSDEDKEKAIKLGAYDYFVKSSTDLSVLGDKIHSLISH